MEAHGAEQAVVECGAGHRSASGWQKARGQHSSRLIVPIVLSVSVVGSEGRTPDSEEDPLQAGVAAFQTAGLLPCWDMIFLLLCYTACTAG
jgi:hypothetical protein